MLEIGDIMQVYGRLSELLALASSMEDPSAELQGALSRAGVDIAVAVSRVSTAVSAALPPTPPPPPPPASFAPPPPPPSSHLPLLPAQPADSWKVTLRVPDEQKLGYTWRNQELWAEARTKPMDIAMVGDAFIDALIVCQGYQMGYSNGEMTRIKQALVSNANLQAIGRVTGLDTDISAPGAPLLQGKAVADQIEALLGAIWLDSEGDFGAFRRALWSIGMFRAANSNVGFARRPNSGEIRCDNGVMYFSVEEVR